MRSSEFFLRSDDRPGRGVARRKPWRGVVAPGTIRARGGGEEGEACGSEKRPKHPSGTFAKPTALSGSTAKRAGRGVLVRTRSGLAGPRGVVPGARPNVNFGLPGVGVDGGGSRMCGCPAWHPLAPPPADAPAVPEGACVGGLEVSVSGLRYGHFLFAVSSAAVVPCEL